MISTNLNAIDSWERGRRETEPETPDVDRTPGSERSPRTEIHRGSRGRGRKPDHENDDAPDQSPDDDEPADSIEVESRFDRDESPPGAGARPHESHAESTDGTFVIDESDDDQKGRYVDIDA